MANTKSAIKTIRKNSRETLINKSRKSRFKNAIKKMNILIEKKNKKDATAAPIPKKYFSRIKKLLEKLPKKNTVSE